MIHRFFINNWQRKIVAIVTAIVIWYFVNHSILDTKVIPNIPIRIEHLPNDKTIQGLMPNGLLSRRVTLTLTGSKDIIDSLEPGDIEVLLDASTADHDEWIVHIAKKNLVSLNPDIDLSHHVTSVDHTDFVIKLSKLITAKVPVTIMPPRGESPPGFEYLDYWPQKLTQNVSGPEEDVNKLKLKGLELTFDLNEISSEDLNAMKSSQGDGYNDEIRYIVPNKWKMVSIPFHNNALEEINDPETQYLRIYFLRKQTLAIKNEIPVTVFYPLENSDKINPETTKLVPSKYLKVKNGIPLFTIPLFVKDVSHLFLNIVRDNLQITLVAAPEKERQFLEWSVQVINPIDLEDTYAAYLISHLDSNKNAANAFPKQREELIRKRFREYMEQLVLYTDHETKLAIESIIEEGKISITGY